MVSRGMVQRWCTTSLHEWHVRLTHVHVLAYELCAEEASTSSTLCALQTKSPYDFAAAAICVAALPSGSECWNRVIKRDHCRQECGQVFAMRASSECVLTGSAALWLPSVTCSNRPLFQCGREVRSRRQAGSGVWCSRPNAPSFPPTSARSCAPYPIFSQVFLPLHWCLHNSSSNSCAHRSSSLVRSGLLPTTHHDSYHSSNQGSATNSCKRHIFKRDSTHRLQQLAIVQGALPRSHCSRFVCVMHCPCSMHSR